MTHAEKYMSQVAQVAAGIDCGLVANLVEALLELRDRGGRLFLLGVGGSAANCSHAVNDFRKLCGIEAYTPVDNVAELTARTNDEGWPTVFEAWLRTSHAGARDAVFVLSVGGGDAERNVSANLVRAIDEAKRRGMKVFGIVGRDGGYAKRAGDLVLVIPTVDPEAVTPHTEAFQAVVWHCLVTDPRLMARRNRWEGLETPTP
jgi:D-sedoheptulose 7-phosphate isomerase